MRAFLGQLDGNIVFYCPPPKQERSVQKSILPEKIQTKELGVPSDTELPQFSHPSPGAKWSRPLVPKIVAVGHHQSFQSFHLDIGYL